MFCIFNHVFVCHSAALAFSAIKLLQDANVFRKTPDLLQDIEKSDNVYLNTDLFLFRGNGANCISKITHH